MTAAPAPDHVELSTDDLRAVARYAADCAAQVLPAFEAAVPDDPRPREALAAARAFAGGAARSNRQRTAAVAAHRAAAAVDDEVARLGALACGDAAAAAYLHPIARATQVGHILRAAACVARVAELRAVAAGDDAGRVADEAVATLAGLAAPPVPAVLRRYPPAPAGRHRLAELTSALDAAVRARG
ncbi:putative immunity protein [Cellulomonas iranensis]|uniref:putative immunity protein n=1 Tax=Cellulomonas iranensis TaxID=76862 RepID=UPI000B3D0C2E|nr:exonuclease SbcC [Cellulomonas iranensis]